MTANEKLLLAMSEIDEDIIAEAADIKRIQKFSFKKLSALAAAFILVVGSAIMLRMVTGVKKDAAGDAAPENSNQDFDIFDDVMDEEAEEDENEETKEEEEKK